MIKFNSVTMDAEMPRGDTGDFQIKPTLNGETFLKEGDTVYFTIKTRKDGNIVLQKAITEFEDGTVTIPIAPEDTRNLDKGNYIYGIDIIRQDGTKDNVTPNWKANFTLKEGVKEDG